jgi:hypothetical protein
MQSLPCFLCGRTLEKRTSKNGKPYFVCDACGIQLFIRRKQGIEKLCKLIDELQHQEIYTHTRSPELLRILAILNEISATKAQIKKIEDASFIFLDEEQTSAKRALEEHLKTLLSNLQELAAQSATLNTKADDCRTT